MFTLITVLEGVIISSTQTAGRTILFLLLVMCVILLLIYSRVILVVGPTAAMTSEILRSLAPASASVSIHLVPLEVWLTCATILGTILLRCASLIAIILKLTLTILRSLASISLYEPSKLLVSALTIIRSAASILT